MINPPEATIDNPLAAYDLTGQVALVTGAGSGIGAASARVLAAAGASVWCADVDADRALATATAIGALGRQGVAVKLDVSRRAEVEAVVDRVVLAHGRLDIIANVAGIISNGELADIDEAEVDRIFAVNLKGVLFGCQAAARVMVPARRGSIINLASAAVDSPSPNVGVYAMSKAGVRQMTRTFATELGPSGVRVNAIAPGFIITGMTGRHFTNSDGTVDEARKEMVVKGVTAGSPIERVGDPIDIAQAVLYLASSASSFMTGQTIRPNGGIAMPW